MTIEDPRAIAAGRRGWRVTLAGTAVSSLGNGLTLPFLLVYLHAVLQVPLAIAGLVVSLAGVVGLLATTASGPLGDRIGLGRSVVVGLGLQALGTAVLAVGTALPTAAIGVAVQGAGAGIVWPALTGLVAAQLPPEARSRAYALRFGLLNAGIGVGSLVSGFVVSLRNPASFHVIYGIDAASTAVFAVLAVVGLRGTPGWRPAARAISRERVAPGFRGYRVVLADRPFVGFLLVAFALGVFGYAQLNGPWAAFSTLTAGASTRIVGIAFAVNTAVIVVLQLPVERAFRGLRRSRLLLIACLLWAAAWLMTGLAAVPALHGPPGSIVLAASLGVFGLGETFFTPVVGGIPNSLAPEDLRARYNALASTTWPLGGLVGSPLAGLLLGSAVPVSWIVVIVAGTLLTSLAVLRLGRVLPASAERPPLAGTG